MFSIISALYGQIVETAIIYYGGYAWAWDIAGILLSKLGYGPAYEVWPSFLLLKKKKNLIIYAWRYLKVLYLLQYWD